MPSMSSIHQIFGSILKLRFTSKDYGKEIMEVSDSLVDMTMQLYEKAKAKLLPTPAKFHYIFNLRDVSRVFQGVMSVDKSVSKKPTNTSSTPHEHLMNAAFTPDEHPSNATWN